MLLEWLKRLNGAVRSLRNPSRRPRPARSLPLRLEELETRVVPATTLTWTGAGNNPHWFNAANWTRTGGNDAVPASGDSLVFPGGVANLDSRNDIAGLTLASIQFTGVGYHLSGRPISLTGGITTVFGTGFAPPGTDTVTFPITLTQAQSFDVNPGVTLAFNGGIDSSTASDTALTLDGDGTVALGGTSALGANVDVQAGTLQVNGSLAFNQGVLTVEHNATLTDAGSVTTTSASQVDDHGQITVAAAANGQAAGSLTLPGSLTIESDGTLTDAGTVTVANKGLQDRGTLAVSAGGTLDDQSGIKVESGAELDDAGTVTIESQPAPGVTAPTASLDVAGALTVKSGGVLNDGGALTVQNGALDDNGTLTIEPSATPGAPAGSLDDAGFLTVESRGILNDGGALTVEQTGTLTDAGSVNVGFQTNSGAIRHPGTVVDHGQIAVEGSSNGQAAGTLQVSGSGSTLTVESDGNLTDSGTLTVNKSGVLDDAHLVAVEAGATLEDAGGLTVESGATLDDGGTVTVEGQTLSGTGRGNLTSHGTLEVEAGHTLDVLGDVVLAGTSQHPAILAAAISNAAAPVISLNSGATLRLDTAGTGTTELNLSAASGFVPTAGQQLTLVANATGSPVQGLFDDTGGNPLHEADVVPLGALAFKITYAGGQGGQGGHDVVLTNLTTSIDASRLSVPLLLDGDSLPGGPLQLIPGHQYTLSDPNAAAGGSVVFTVNPDRTVNYDPSLDGVLSGRGTSTLVITGRTMTIDASPLSVPALTLDGTLSVSNTPFSFTDLPGTYALVDSGGAGASVAFNLNADGTVGYDPSLEGVLTGAGTNALVVHGVAVQIDPRPLSADNPPVPVFTVEGQPAYSTQQVQTVSVLPGALVILIDRHNGPTRLDFTVSAQDQLSLVDPTEASFVSFTGANQVTLLGGTPTQFSIGIVSNLSVPLTLDGQALPPGSPPQLAAGAYTLSDPNAVAGGSVTFNVTSAGAVDYDPSLDGVLSGRGTSTLIVNGRTIGILASELSIAALTLDQMLTLTRPLPAVYSFTDLPGTYSLLDSAGSGASIQFLLNGDGTVGYDSSLQGVLLGAGGNRLIVRGVAVIIEAQALFSQFNPPLVTSIIVDGQAPSTQAMQKVFLLPGAFSIQYTTSTNLNVIVNFTVSAQDVVAYVSDNQNLSGDPLGEVSGNNNVFLPPPL
jgi:hypothetical protein